MSDSSKPVRRRRRANWVALRTLRRLAKSVGQTAAGDPVYEIGAVRLVLPADTVSFHRVIVCSKCGHDVPGAAVLGRGDLARPAHGVICQACITAAAPVFRTEERSPAVPGRSVLNAASPNGALTGHAELTSTSDVRLAALEQRLAALAAPLHGEPTGWEASADGQPRAELTTLVEGLSRTAEPCSGRLQAFERQVQEAVHRLAETMESQQADLQAALGKGLDEVRSAMATVATSSVSRLEDLEERAAKGELEVSEVRELQAGLDGELDELRSEIASVRHVNRELSDDQAEVNRRLDAVSEVERAARPVQDRRRGLGRNSAAQSAGVGIVLAAVENLVRDHQQLKAHLVTLEQSVQAGASEAVTASSHASALAAVRTEVRALREQLETQNETLLTVRRSVERLRRRVAVQAPPAKRTLPGTA